MNVSLHAVDRPAAQLYTLLHDSKATNRPIAVLVTGPPGSGKSTLASEGVRRAGFRMVRLCPRDLAVDQAGLVEGIISDAFSQLQPFQSGYENATGKVAGPVAVILDDLDFWAPAKVHSASDLRIIAALCEELTALHEISGFAAAFVCTACVPGAVHPTLFRARGISTVLSLHALSLEERTRLSLQWLVQVYRKTGESVLSSVAAKIARITPGFMYADMDRLFSHLAQSYLFSRVGLAETDPNLFLLSPHFWNAVKMVKPSLLTIAQETFGSDIGISKPSCFLYGLEHSIKLFQECLKATFSTCIANPTCSFTSSYQALQQLGICKGLILYGPTGCGKSAIARLASDMVEQSSINILHAESTSIVSSIIGDAERKLSHLFTMARAIAPAIVVLENIDILAPSRDSGDEGSTSEAFNRLLGTLLTEVDGVGNHLSGPAVFIIATTRSLSLVDHALLRPGRFEIHLPVYPPDSAARAQILRAYLSSKGLCNGEGPGKGRFVDFENFANKTGGWTAPRIQAFGRGLILRVARDSV